MQYTVRGIPSPVDSALRERAKAEGKSLNDVTIEALADGAGVSGAPRRRRLLQDLAGTWLTELGVDSALQDQKQIDVDLWK